MEIQKKKKAGCSRLYQVVGLLQHPRPFVRLLEMQLICRDQWWGLVLPCASDDSEGALD